ncbi:MAG TPA: hypothetical protein PKA85_00005 [Ferruginibacter sp.]|nr:hypothetical protein [Ferruginibacter sp.]
MTGSGSRGNGGVYHYYHCQRAYGCKNSIPAQQANQLFNQFIGGLQPQSEEIELYLHHLEEEFKKGGADRESEKIRLRNEINRLEESLNSAAVKNINGIIDDDRYVKVKNELETKQTELQVRLNSLNALPPEFATYVQNSTALASNLRGYYQNATSDIQKKLAGSIITGKLYLENKIYRTTKINEAIAAILSMGKGFNENCPAENARQSSLAPPVGLEPTTL